MLYIEHTRLFDFMCSHQNYAALTLDMRKSLCGWRRSCESAVVPEQEGGKQNSTVPDSFTRFQMTFCYGDDTASSHKRFPIMFAYPEMHFFHP